MSLILITHFYGNISIIPYPIHPQSLFLYEWGGNFEFEFCKNIEDKLNGDMPCITHSVVFHAYLMGSQIYLALSGL